MKKLFYFLFALAAMLLTNTSCSDDLENSVTSDNEATVSFKVQLESAVNSRAVGDGTTAKELQYAVYKVDATGKTIGTEIAALAGQTTVDSDLKATVTLTLVKGQTYNFLFWAQSPNNDYYTLNKAEGEVTVTYKGKAANDEKRDAFFKVRKDLKVTGPINETIVLKRPFAQVNVGTTIGSLAAAKKADTEITNSSFTIKNAANTLNAYTGAATGEEDVTFSSATIIESNKADNVGDLKNVASKDYEYLAMNYILVASDEADEKNLTDAYGVGENKALVNATLELFDENNNSVNKFEIPNVPVQRNFRTNIIGEIMNANVTFNVVVDPNFDGEHNYNTNEELAYILKNGGEYTFPANGTTTLETPYVVENGASVILNLNGNQIKTTNGSDAFIVNDGTLTIKGEGSVTTEDKTAGYAIIVDGANAVANIYGGTYTIGLDDVTENGTNACNSAVYTKNGGKANIYGGTYQVSTTQTTDEVSLTRFLINKNDKAETKGGPITIYGGTFVKFNPASNVADGEKTNFVADGYSSTKVGEKYVVAKGTGVATATALTTAWEEGGEISLVTNIQLGATPLILKDGKEVTIHLNGNTITAGTFAESNGNISTGDSDSYPFYVQGGTLTIEGEGNISAQAATYSMAVFAAGGEVNIYGGYYTNAGHGSDLIYAKNAAVINIYGGTFKAVKNDGTESGTDQDYSALNLRDGSDATITVYGGSFYKFDPANNASEGAGTNFVATGYKSVKVGDWYKVVEE